MHFKVTYKGHELDLPIENPVISLRSSVGSWPGQAFEDFVRLEIGVQSPKFLFDPNNTGGNDDNDEDCDWLTPGVNTQWLEIPLSRFKDRDIRSLHSLRANFEGEGTPNALTREPWKEAPGVLHMYTNEWFKQATIDIRLAEKGLVEAVLTGTTDWGSSFDIHLRAPLTVRLAAYRGHTADEFLDWFDRFLKRDDFAMEVERIGEDVYVNGVLSRL